MGSQWPAQGLHGRAHIGRWRRLLCKAREATGPGTGCGVRAVEAQEWGQGAEMVLQRRTTKNKEAPSAMVVPRQRRKREVRETMNGSWIHKSKGVLM